VVFLLSGLWHGANWTFICWGAVHGIFLLLERGIKLNLNQRNPAVSLIKGAITFGVVMLS